MIKIGDKVHAIRMPKNSDCHQVIGKVVGLSNGYVQLKVDSVISKLADDGKFYSVERDIVDIAKIDYVVKI